MNFQIDSHRVHTGNAVAEGLTSIRIDYDLLYPDEIERLLARRGLRIPPGDPNSDGWRERAMRLLESGHTQH